MTSTLQDRLRDMLPGLPAELQRAARWALDNPAEVGLWSMRRQAQAVGVAPATMLRMARAAGCDTYEAFRAPFQRALTQGMEAGWRDRAARLQARRAETPAVDARAALTRWQTAALESIGAVNADSAFDEAAATLLAARQAGFLGTRSAFGIAFQMRYAYQMLCRNGMLMLIGASAPPPRRPGPGRTRCVVVTQAPYAAATLELAGVGGRARAAVIALTDAPPARSFRSPAMSCASRGRGCARRHGRTRFVLPQHGGPARPGRAPDRARRRPGRRRRIATAVRNRIAPARRWRVLARNAWPPSPSARGAESAARLTLSGTCVMTRSRVFHRSLRATPPSPCAAGRLAVRPIRPRLPGRLGRRGGVLPGTQPPRRVGRHARADRRAGLRAHQLLHHRGRRIAGRHAGRGRPRRRHTPISSPAAPRPSRPR